MKKKSLPLLFFGVLQVYALFQQTKSVLAFQTTAGQKLVSDGVSFLSPSFKTISTRASAIAAVEERVNQFTRNKKLRRTTAKPEIRGCTSTAIFASSKEQQQQARTSNFWDSFASFLQPTTKSSSTSNRNVNGGGYNEIEAAKSVVRSFLTAYNQQSVIAILSLFTDGDGDDVDTDNDGKKKGIYSLTWDDYAFSSTCKDKTEFERRLRLQFSAAKTISTTSNPKKRWLWNEEQHMVAATTVASDSTTASSTAVTTKVAVRIEDAETGQRGVAWLTLTRKLNEENPKILRVKWVTEEKIKKGEGNLLLLAIVSKVIGINPVTVTSKKGNISISKNSPEQKSSEESKLLPALSPPERYFAAWNRRDMAAAVDVFTNDVSYDDTAFPQAFEGKDNLRKHLYKCADCFPDSFTFEIDDIIIDDTKRSKIAVQWHVENAGESLPYSRGCSFYTLDSSMPSSFLPTRLNSSSKQALIRDGIDFVEPPGPIKPGGRDLFVQSMKTKLAQEPMRWIPLSCWFAYMYIVFFSDSILPGANALQLEARTWEEVINLSLNFFLVSPLLHLPFSPSVHPMLEGVFNLLLSWAAMFAGFLSDDRKNKPNLIPMLPIVVGMQFLTSAFLLPYLAIRTSELQGDDDKKILASKESATLPITKKDLGKVAQVCESRALGAAMGFVGTGSIFWGVLLGRVDEYGAEFNGRLSSFVDLLSIDRVGSSFLVDLVIFGLFQGWLVDDDLRRRGEETNSPMSFVAKYIPFFGMAFYLMLRKPIKQSSPFTANNAQPESSE